jgi:hypothetical protein
VANIKDSPASSINSDELWQRFQAHAKDVSTVTKTTTFGKTIRKLFPDVTVHSANGKVSEKCAKVYKGITWDLNELREIQWTDVPSYIPRTASCLKQHDSNILSVVVPTSHICNGSVVIKQVDFFQSSLTWELKIRGTKVDINKLDLDHQFTLTANSIQNIIKITEQILICTGVSAVKDEYIKDRKRFSEELVSIQGDENSGNLRARSANCTQVLGWCSQAKCAICRSCQFAFAKYKAKSLSLEESVPVPDVNSDSDLPNEADISLNEADHTDLVAILDQVFPNASKEMKVLLKAQHDALNAKTRQSNRWDKNVISTCLSLWVRSPKAYADLTDSKMLLLPSGRQLRRYKNCVPQESGINDQVLQWMRAAATEAKVPDHGWAGGLHHDEMKLQQDLVLSMVGGKPSLVGWIDVGEEAANLRMLKEGCVKQTLASEVIQVTFMGYTGFRFPLCHYPTGGVKSSELHIIIWDAIAKLSDWGFTVDFINQDGGEENRQFMRSNFDGDPVLKCYASPNLTNQTRSVVHTQDFSHNMKKLRNAVLKSGETKGQHTRKLVHQDNPIVWQQWIDAVEWDRTVNSRPLHFKVTDTHLHPNGSEKMRNQLAEQMLDEDMLHLMHCYQASLEDETKSTLSSTIALLEHSSQLISVFRGRKLITSVNDERFSVLAQAKEWFSSWRDSIRSDDTLTNGQKSKMLPSKECLDDMICMLVTFPKICKIHLSEYKIASIMPSRFNNDVAENMFCQQRGLYNGNSTNPNYAAYRTTVNSVLLGQSLLSRGRKSNAGLRAAKPFNHYVAGPVCKRVKKDTSGKCKPVQMRI